jgi:hypothetical protein
MPSERCDSRCRRWDAHAVLAVLVLLSIAWSDAAEHRASAGAACAAASRLASSLRLRGGKSREGGVGDPGAGKGLQLPLLRNMLDLSTSLTVAANGTAPDAAALTPGSLDPERMAFLRNAFAEILENTTDVFATSISRLSLPEDCEANVSLKENALSAIAGLGRARLIYSRFCDAGPAPALRAP